jgi:acetyltransferase-like isoleucine patch superfamily enzyme
MFRPHARAETCKYKYQQIRHYHPCNLYYHLLIYLAIPLLLCTDSSQKLPLNPGSIIAVTPILHAKLRLLGNIFRFIRRDIEFASWPMIYGYWPCISNAGTVKIGKRLMFRSLASRSYIAVEKGAVIEIGDHGFINEGVKMCATTGIKIGRDVKIGEAVYIYDSDFHQVTPDQPTKRKHIVIGDNVWIGARAIILPGANIGDHAVIGAGSVVTGQIPACSVAVGTPAKIIRRFAAPPPDWERP